MTSDPSLIFVRSRLADLYVTVIYSPILKYVRRSLPACLFAWLAGWLASLPVRLPAGMAGVQVRPPA